MAWLINGESGKPLNATQRTLEELRVDSARLSFGNLRADELSWEVATTDAAGGGAIIPEIGQLVELFNGSTRRFKGHVTSVRVRTRSVAILAQGPWWWMERTPLTQSQTDATNVSAERASYIFPTQSLKTSLENFIDRAIDNGVPMVRGTVGTMFDCPRITLAEMNCSSALVELMRWVPDSVAWFDYSGTTPALNITRRGDMTALNLTVGTDALEAIDIAPRLDLEVARTELHFVTRQATTGLPQWASQSSGTSAPGKRQIITVSGPEIVDFVPQDDFERIAIYYKGTSVSDVLRFVSKQNQKLVNDWSTAEFNGSAVSDPYSSGSSNRAIWMNGFEAWEFVDGGYTNTATTIPSGRTALILGLEPGQQQAPDWLIAAGASKMMVNDYWVRDGNSSSSSPVFDIIRRRDIVATLRPDIRLSSSNSDGTGNGSPSYNTLVRTLRNDSELAIWTLPTAQVPATIHSGTSRSSSSQTQIQLATTASTVDGFYNGEPIFWTRNGVRHGGIIASYVGSTRIATLAATVPSEIAPANSLAYIIPGSFISPATYDYLNPPTGLAANLQTAQSWVPWEGQVTLVDPVATGANLLARKVNIAGTITAAATMGAMLSGVSYELLTERTNYDLGAPARSDFGTLIGRIRREPKDNIVYL
jgi:hypothetical protein